MNYRDACVVFFGLIVGNVLVPVSTPVIAQPDMAGRPEPADDAHFEADNKAYEDVKRNVRGMGRNAIQALAAWQQLLEARPNMVPIVGYMVFDQIGILQADALSDTTAALATYESGLKKYGEGPASLVLVSNKGRILMRMNRVDEAEAAMRPFWPIALKYFDQNMSKANSVSPFLMRRYIQALEQLKKEDEAIAYLRSAVLAKPRLLAEDWMLEALATKYVARQQYDEALAFARIRFMTASFSWRDLGESVQLLARVWRAKEGPDSPSLRAFMEHETDPAKPNPLRAVALPKLTAADKDALLAFDGYLLDRVDARLLAGATAQALAMPYRSAMYSPQYPRAVSFICQTIKGIDLSTRRANAFINYLHTGQGDNPLEELLREANVVPPPNRDGAPEAQELQAFEELKASMAQNKADSNTQLTAYTKFIADRPHIQLKVGVRVADTVGQIHAQQLNNPAKAQEVYKWAWKQYQRHPDALRLAVADFKLAGKDIVPSTIDLRKLQLVSPGAGAPAIPGEAGGEAEGEVNPGVVKPPAPAAAPPFGAGEAAVQNPQAPAAEAGLVTNTGDNGPGSLRQALLHASSTPGTKIRFNIPNTDPNFKAGVFTITAVTLLPAIKGVGTVIDGSTQTAFTGDTNAAGPEIQLLSSATSRRGSAIYIISSQCEVRSLTLSSADGAAWHAGVQITGPGASGNRVVGCYIGVDPTGTVAMGSRFGVAIENGANNNVVGGTTPEARNIIAGNGRQISIEGTGTSGNVVQGNFLGTSADGEKVFPDTDAVGIGGGASKNSIGGSVAGAGNLIVSSGDRGSGVRIGGRGSNGNIIQGNLIGTNKTGLKVLAVAQYGVMVLNGIENTQIGGTTPMAGNLIAGSRTAGVQLSYNSNNVVQGNYIGCDVSGKRALGNGDGVIIYVGTGHLIGGAEPGAGNIIGGGVKSGVVILGEAEPNSSTRNSVQGNFIGVAADGKTALPNGDAGVRIAGGSHNNIIGIAADGKGAGNTIAFNKGKDVKVEGDEKVAPTGNVVAGNTAHDNGG